MKNRHNGTLYALFMICTFCAYRIAMADGIPPESGSALVSSPSDSSTASGLSAFLSSDSYIVWVVFLIGVISLAVALFSKKKR